MPVIIVPYNPTWPGLYEEERRFIVDAVGEKIISLDHIGSTSVPGLGAKPIIDILAGVKDRRTADEIVKTMKHLGYAHVSPGDHQDWFYCICRVARGTRFHLHLIRHGSKFHAKHIIFREWLRAHPDDARRYYELKRNLAQRYSQDSIAYADAKTDFIDSIVGKAKKMGESS